MRMMVLIAVMCGACEVAASGTAVQAIAGPGGVTVTPRVDPGQLAVSWTADPAATSYQVFQSAGGGPLAFAASVFDSSGGVPPTSYIADGLSEGSYCYSIRASYSDGSTSELGPQACATVIGDASTGAPLRRRNVPLNLSWINPANTWAATDVGVRSTSTASTSQGATSIDVPFEVGDTIVGAEVWRFSDGSDGAKGALLAIAAGSDAPSIIAFGSDSIARDATARAMYSVPEVGGHTMVAGERLRLMLFALSSPGYTIDSVNLLYTAAPATVASRRAARSR